MDRFKSHKHIHFVGIGGIGISYIAQFFLERGIKVTGSDLTSTNITDLLSEKGATISFGHSADLVTPDIDLVVYNGAVPQDNPERLKAAELGIELLTNFQVAGELSKEFSAIAISGNKGKTTTTAMIGAILESAGQDPTVMVGSLVNAWKTNFRHGQSKHMVIEACEFQRQFLHIKPMIGVITNIGLDHMDFYKTEDQLVQAFQDFVNQIPSNGLLVINGDDQMTHKLDLTQAPVKSIGQHGATLNLDARSIIGNGKQELTLTYQGEVFKVVLPAPGLFNAYNAMAAMLVCLHLGLSIDQIQTGIASFSGTWRRFQYMGEYKGATIINDYAHNPPALSGVIAAAKEVYPGQRIVAVFQSHTRHRTLSLFNEFVESLDEADVIMIPEIYHVAGREQITDEQMNAGMLVDAVKKRDVEHGRLREVVNGGTLQETRVLLDDMIQPNDVVLLIGAGPIYLIGEELGQ